jgi:hypothetical protein
MAIKKSEGQKQIRIPINRIILKWNLKEWGRKIWIHLAQVGTIVELL